MEYEHSCRWCREPANVTRVAPQQLTDLEVDGQGNGSPAEGDDYDEFGRSELTPAKASEAR